MRFDAENEGWAPAHDREVRLRSSLGLIIGLLLMVVSAGALFAMPIKSQEPRHAMAAVMP
jgi:hypothetical protein